MWLLNVNTLETKLKSPLTGDYATLSHTWGEEEVTFEDLQRPDQRSKKGYSKIRGCCNQAKKDGINWVWIDTCCIDKTSSAELSEAINSMYAWYRDSAVCYVFLDDVPPLAPCFPESEFQKARWFTRGWCLQELIAPPKVEFYAKDWTDIGTRWSLHGTITKITGIPRSVLLKEDGLQKFSIAQKMSWASKRRTEKEEDEAYCLLGIFDVNMPLIYGEGRKAFQRLQSEILRWNEDYSFLLWTTQESQDINESLAPAALVPEFFQREGLSLSARGRCPYGEVESAKSLLGHLSQELARRSPPQLTRGGLQVEMLVQTAPHPILVPEHEEISLLLFTEFMYHGKLVCIALDENDDNDVLTTYWREFCHRVFLVDADLIESFELLKIHLAASPPGHGSESKPSSEPPGLRIHLLSNCCSTTISLIQSIPRIKFFIPGQPLTYDPPPGPRLQCLELDSEVQESQPYQPGIPLLLRLKLCRNESGAMIETDLILSIWLNPLAPRCCVRPYTDSGKLALEGANEHLQLLKNKYGKSTDRAHCELPNGRDVIWVMVKGCNYRESVRSGVPQKPVYAVHVTVLEDTSTRQYISQEKSEGSEIRKRKRTLSQQSEDIDSCLEASDRRSRHYIEISSDSE